MSQATIPDLQRVNSIWFDDGNLIVIAEPKVFRLYKYLLARRSPIFKDMLSIPQPDASIANDAADQRVVDSLGLDTTRCALVRLMDKPQDVEWFLSAFFHDSHIAQYSTNTSALTGTLRLAAKYEVTFLRKWALDCLEKLYPFTVNIDTDDLLQTLRRKEKKNFEWMNGMFTLINVAMTVGVPWVLPQVLWRLQNAGLADILNHPDWIEFPEEKKTQFLLGREYKNEAGFGAFGLLLGLHRDGTVHGTTPKGGACGETFKQTLHLTIGKKGSVASKNPLWTNYVDEWGCSECKQRYAAERRDMIVDLFLALQRRNGLPEPEEMMELRKQWYQEISMHEY